MSDDIERPSFTTWCLACFGTEAGACSWFLGVQKVNRPPFWQLLAAMVLIAVLYVVVYQWRCWKWRSGKVAKAAKDSDHLEKVNRIAGSQAGKWVEENRDAGVWKWNEFLNEEVKCKGNCLEPRQPRRDFYKSMDQAKIDMDEMCSACFYRHFREAAHDHPALRRWPDAPPLNYQ